ncbi:MAG: glutathione peroxidase [Deltaproteobacteria bacterium]|nr:glutathione peroxidase [Deltaproteobacteria bacterium]
MCFHDFTVKALDGKDHPLTQYKGKVVLVVNTASECGFTPQYAGLEKLHEEYAGKGLVVLGVPSNDFGAQEPGTPEQIQAFCETKFHVRFPLTEKMVVKGKAKAPLYGFLTEDHGEPKWNFHKFLVGKDGEVIDSFNSAVGPDSKSLRGAIDKALQA